MNNYQTTFNPFSQNIGIVKSYFRKPRVLTQGILYIISAILSIATVVLMMPIMNNYIDTILSLPQFTADMTAQDMEFLSSFMDIYINSVMFTSLICSVAVTALVATAYLLIYFKSKSDNPMSTPKAGVTILYVLAIIQLIPIIMLTALIALLIIMMFILAFAPSMVGETESGPFAIIAVIYTIVFGGMCTLLLLYYINQVRYYKSIRTSLTSVSLTYKGAGIFGVLSMIYGIYAALSSFSGFGVIPMFNMFAEIEPELAFMVELIKSFIPAFIISAVASLLMGTIYILNAVIALGYKNHIKNYIYNYNEYSAPDMNQPQPVYDAPQQAPYEAPKPQAEPEFQSDVFYENNEVCTTVACPRCGTVAKENDVFCSECGAKIK